MEVLHVTRVTAASSGTHTSTVMNRAARPSAYTGAPNNIMCDTGGEPRGHRRCPRRYRRYLVPAVSPVTNVVSRISKTTIFLTAVSLPCIGFRSPSQWQPRLPGRHERDTRATICAIAAAHQGIRSERRRTDSEDGPAVRSTQKGGGEPRCSNSAHASVACS